MGKKILICFLLLLCPLHMTGHAVEMKYSMMETFRILNIMSEDFVHAMKDLTVTDDELSSFVEALNQQVASAHISVKHFDYQMYKAMETVLFSGNHNNLLAAITAQYTNELSEMMTTKKTPERLMPLRDTVFYCVFGKGEEIQLFTDVDSSHWARQYIEQLAIQGIVNGMGNRLFAPEQAVTREEFVKLLVETLELPRADHATPFRDVDTSAWYAPYVVTAYENQLVSGVSDTEFGVGQPISRQDMAVLLHRIIQQKNLVLTEEKNVIFTDQDQIASYATDAVQALCTGGVLSGEDGKFLPNEPLTRAQAARILYVLGGLL